jgi:serine acetyltransferase
MAAAADLICVSEPAIAAVPRCEVDFQRVAVGKGNPVRSASVLAGHIDIAASDKVLGVTLDGHAVICGNAVLLCDFPAEAIAVGVPAGIVVLSEAVRPPSRTLA